MLDTLKKKLKFYSQLDMSEIVFHILTTDDAVRDRIISLNTLDQLFNKGIDSTGTPLSDIGGDYSPFTVEDKKDKGLPFNRVTLFDRGDFYASFDLIVTKSFIEITANPIKVDDSGRTTNLQSEWGEDILGLTEESRQILIDMLIPRIQNYINARS